MMKLRGQPFRTMTTFKEFIDAEIAPDIYILGEGIFLIFGKINAPRAKKIQKMNPGICICEAEPTVKSKELVGAKEFFTMSTFMIDALDHPWMPKFQKLSSDEIEELDQVCKGMELPRILHSDIVMRLLGANVGDVFRIKRDRAVYFRKVI